MKKYILLSSVATALLCFSSCEDFLDTLPDNRAEVNTEEKITSLLVSAYPGAYPVAMFEMASDNTADNGSLYDVETQATEQAYLWQDIDADTDQDCPQGLWDECYTAIGAANQALQSIEELGNPESLNPQKGEALICRAYAHFILVNTFCQAYNPGTAADQLGIPYMTEPETTVSPTYSRGTLAETYQKIDADIQAALPLIDDNLYTVPKYHFNMKSAYAFAARFYLFYVQEDKSNYEKVIEYANKVLGSNMQESLRSYSELTVYTDPDNIGDAYIDASNPANLLITTVYSSWPYIYGPWNLNLRYGMNRSVCEGETFLANAPWGTNIAFRRMIYNPEQKINFPKYMMYFEYTDKVNGIGYRHAVIVPFSTNETLLCRAEAYVMKAQPDYTSATADLNSWASCITMSGTSNLTESQIEDFYNGIDYTPVPLTSDGARTVKKYLNPIFPFADVKQENFIHCILHARRMECIHDGSRWLDIKRYNIEISHNREGLDPDVLKANDLRRAIQLPQDVINAGLEANPR